MTTYSSTPRAKLSAHQINVLRAILKGNPASPTNPAFSHVDLDELLERVPRNGKPIFKQSMQATLRALILYGLVEKLPRELRRDRSRVLFKLTALGEGVAADRVAQYAFVGGPEDDE